MRHEYDPYPFYNWFKKQFGDKTFDNLYSKYNTTVKYKDDELLKMIFEFQDKFKMTIDCSDSGL